MRRILFLGLLAGVVISGGCGAVATQTVGGITGASGRYFEIRSLGAGSALDRFAAVQVEAFDPSPMLGAIPNDIFGPVQPEIIDRLAKSGLFSQVAAKASVRPALIIRGKFMDYDPGGSTVRVVYGVNPMLSAQIEISDADTGRVLGVTMVRATVTSVVRTGPSEQGLGLGKAIKDLLASHTTRKPQKD